MGLPTPQGTTDTTDPVSASAVPVGQKQPLGAITIPGNCTRATLTLDSSWHTDPESIAVWGLDVSLDGGKTWEHWCTVTRGGGPAFTDGGVQVNTFDVTAPMVDVERGSFDIRG